MLLYPYFSPDMYNYNYMHDEMASEHPALVHSEYRQLFPGFGNLFGPPSPPPPAQGPGGQPPVGGPSQSPGSGPPTAPPPSFVPQQQAQTFAVDPGGIRRCLFRYTYVWLNNRQQFWFYPIFVGRTSVAGWRWNGFSWFYFGISLRQIQSFTCV